MKTLISLILLEPITEELYSTNAMSLKSSHTYPLFSLADIMGRFNHHLVPEKLDSIIPMKS